MLNFNTVTTYKTFTTLQLVGFHNTRRLEGEMFLSKEEADQYCADKVVYSKELKFNSEAEAMAFIINQLTIELRQHTRAGGGVDTLANETPCKAIRELIAGIKI